MSNHSKQSDPSDQEEVCAIVARRLGVSAVTPEMRLVEELGAESLDFVAFAAAIEQALGVVLSDDALFESETVQDFVTAVARARGSVDP
jgi:acyl carrier protein